MKKVQEMWTDNATGSKLMLYFVDNIWVFQKGVRKIIIIAWRDTEKRYMVQMILTGQGVKSPIILEISSKSLNKELFSPKKETAKKVARLCQELAYVNIWQEDMYYLRMELKNQIEKILKQDGKIKAVDVYCGDKALFALRTNCFGKIKMIGTAATPEKSIEFPNIRVASIIN